MTEALLGKFDRTASESTIAIQGFGNVGSWAADYLHSAGARVVAISDISGAFYDSKGIHIPAAIAYVREHGTLKGFETEKMITNEELLELEVDVLIPAALGGVLTKENAGNVRASYIVEAANGPVDPEADDILQSKEIIVLPDILANAGGVTVSYFEWVQNQQYFKWDLDRTRNELSKKLTAAFDKMWSIATEKHISLRSAAYLIGIGRVGRATVLAGI
ncbi:MAG TPA: hypothetical protein DCG12_08115 [Planctomycetaceae bacterium]|nr:hypothetical protein [Planctomycetaceae bacterium]